jgi:hypothetical protein
MAITKIMLKSEMPPKLPAIGRYDKEYYDNWTFKMQKKAYNPLFSVCGQARWYRKSLTVLQPLPNLILN